MASSRHAFGDHQEATDVANTHLQRADQISLEQERFTPSPVGQSSQSSAVQYNGISYEEHREDYHQGTGTNKEYQPVATTTFATSRQDTFSTNKSPGLVSRVFFGWWKELLWCVVSIACIPALVGMLRRFENQPLPDWPHGITLNTAVAFISTLCRTAFLLPVVEALSQLKWNWYRKPRALQDFRVFDEASRGPWGSLKLLFTTKGRYVDPIQCFSCQNF